MESDLCISLRSTRLIQGEYMNFEWIIKLWNESVQYTIIQTLLIASFFLLMNLVLFLAVWYIHKNTIFECGYHNKRGKQLEKKISEYKLFQKITLIKLAAEAPNKGMMLYINMFCHILNVIAFIICIAGYVCCYIFNSGWAWCLLLLPEICTVFLIVAIEFVPHLIWLPSEKKRYSK